MVERALRQVLVPVLAIAALAIAFARTPLPVSVGNLIQDRVVSAASRWPPSPATPFPDTMVVAIDTRSLQAYADWPWPRSRYAELIRRLDRAGARAIAFDIDFSTARDPAGDRELARAIGASGRVALGAIRQFQVLEGLGELELASLPRPELAKAAVHLGTSNFPLERDGSVRKTFGSLTVAGRRLPSLARAALAVVREEPVVDEPASEIPIDFRRANPPVPIVGIVDLIEGRVDPAFVSGRVVFVGATAPILQDLWATPIGPSVPGVVIQAIEYRHQAARAAGQTVLRSSTLMADGSLALLLSLLGRLLIAGAPWVRLGTALGLASALLGGCLGAAVFAGVLVDPLAPLGVVAAHYVLGIERVRRRIGAVLSRRERSLHTVVRVGQVTSRAFGTGGARSALRLLAESSGARAVSLLVLDSSGDFESRPLRWSLDGSPSPIDQATALRVLALRESLTRTDTSSGRSTLYLPLVAGLESMGILALDFDARASPDDMQVETIAAVAGQIALAAGNARLVESLREAMRRADAANRAKIRFLANVSHEIRTPMVAILGYADLLREGATSDAERADLLDLIARNGEHLLNLINAILDLSQLESATLTLAVRRVKTGEIFTDVAELFRREAETKGLNFEFTVSSELPDEVETDPLRVSQILWNLIGNAVKFTERGRVRVEIGVEEVLEGGELMLRIEVSDSGVGMDERTQADLFRPFTQGDLSATRRHGGAGLGLAITKRLVDVLGGSISVQSAPSRGTRFRATIPVKDPSFETGPDASYEEAGRTADGQSREAPAGRVLLAEDGVDNRRILTHFLRRAGLQVEIAENGEVAYQKAMAASEAGNPYDVVLMDVDMPVLDGCGATTMLRESGYGGPVIALTAHTDTGARARCLEAGCDDYVAKPVDRAALVRITRRYAESGRRKGAS